MTRITLALLASVATLGFISSVHAADLIIDEPAAPAYVDASGSWDGVYLGVFAGYGWGLVDDSIDANLGLTDDELDLTGWLLGVNAGANFTLTEGIVAGVVGDIAWSNISGEEGLVSYDVNWTGSVRGRLGFDGGAFMPYVTGGLAFANATADDGANDDTQTHIGWTAGAGVEFAATEDLSVDLQYRYSDFGTADYALTSTDELGLTSHAVTVGLNWKF